jgi:hypothetical protein
MSIQPRRYRKLPVVIEAVQYLDTPECLTALSDMGLDPVRVDYSVTPPVLIIPTLEGDMRVLPGDYIIKGVKGEFYSCKPDIFAATYEPAED